MATFQKLRVTRVDALCDDALQHVGLTLASCPRNTEVSSIPAPFRLR